MTRKHFLQIAQAIRFARDAQVTDHDKALLEGMAHHIATTLRHDNPRFDYDLFIRACGVKQAPRGKQ